jgi:hypothetical protein
LAQVDFDYEPSYSLHGGLLLREWNGAIIFDYTRFSNDTTFAADSSGAVVVSGSSSPINVRGSADVELDSYDLSLSKTIQSGGPSCGSYGASNAGFLPPQYAVNGCRWRPRWDLTYSGGLRYADVEYASQTTEFNPATGSISGTSSRQFDFDGLGGHVGLLGRRYLGHRGIASLYAKGDLSLLFGDFESTETASSPSPRIFRSAGDGFAPVTEIELGSTLHVGRYANLSAGYFWSAWEFNSVNELGFDGLTARAEVTY